MRRYANLCLILGLMLGISALTMAAPPEQRLTEGRALVGSLHAYWQTGVDEQSALDVDLIIPDGTTSGNDFYGIDLLIQANDADADLNGIQIIMDATSAAAAASYEAGIKIDCEENTAGACTSGIIITSTGVNNGLTTAIDVSAANIGTAIDIGDNTFSMGAGSISADSYSLSTTDDITFTLTAGSAAEDFTIDQNGNTDSSILISTEGSGTDALSLSTLTNGGDIVISSVDNIQIISTTASGLIDIDGTAGLTYSIAEDDTAADDIDLGSAKDDVDIEGEDITLHTSDDADFIVADDFAFTMESAGGIWAVQDTAGGVMRLGTDDTVADTIGIGSAKDDVDLAGEDITLTSADDLAILSASAGGILNVLTGTDGYVLNVATDDTAADTIAVGSAKDDVTVAGEDITLTTADDVDITSTSASGIIYLGGTPGLVLNLATDDTTADDVNIGSAKDDVDVAGEDITLTSADDLALLSSSAGGILNVMTGTAGYVVNIGTDNSAADDINVGSALDAFDVDGATIVIGAGGGTVAVNSSDWDVTTDGNMSGIGTFAANGDATWTGNDTDVTLSGDSTNGNALAKNEFVGLPRIMNYGIGTMADASDTIITDIGDSETPATDWTQIDADTTMSNDSTYYRQGTASLKMVLGASAAATDGCTNALASGNQNWTDVTDAEFGMWVYATVTFDANDLELVISDSGAGDTSVAFPAYTTANVWQWMELDVGTPANASKDDITDLSIELSAGSDLIGSEASLYFDFIVKWDEAELDSLGSAILNDGLLSLSVIDATSGASSLANLTLYTDYFVAYKAGVDYVVVMTDQSDADKLGLALIAY